MLALRNWRVASRLILLVVIPAILGLTLAGLQVASDSARAGTYGQLSRVAALGQQVTGLAQALEGERNAAAAFIAAGRPAAGLAVVRRQYASTDGWAALVSRQVHALDRADQPARTRASAAAALASVAELPGLRRETAQGQASALAVTQGYSAAITGLFPVIDGSADLSGNPVLITSVRALGSLARLKDQISLQQAIVGPALTAGRFEPGALAALAIARAQAAGDLAAFRSSATAQESWALTRTMAGTQPRQASAVEQRAIAAGDGPLALGPAASAQWQAGTSYTVGWLRHAEQQLARWITATARTQQRGARTSAMVMGGVAAAGLVLTVLITLIIVRSVVRPLRRLQAVALEAAESRLPAEIRAVAADVDAQRPVPALPVDVSSGDEISQVALALSRLHQEAVRMAGEEARLRASAGAVIASFFRRSHALHDRLLRLVDSMELSEDDPERLARLFEMDNLATQMRRHSDTALVLAGHETPRIWTEPVALVDVLRAAASEIEYYDQIALEVQSGVSVSEAAAVDTVHLLAELLENATTFSPETTQVVASGYLDLAGGALITITDAGPGLPEDYLRWLNWQLAHPRPADAEVAHQMGLFAVAHLAARHRIIVVLTSPADGGITAEVHLPAEMISEGPEPGDGSRELGAGYGHSGAAALAGDPRSLPSRLGTRPHFTDQVGAGRLPDSSGEACAGEALSSGEPPAGDDDLPLMPPAPVVHSDDAPRPG